MSISEPGWKISNGEIYFNKGPQRQLRESPIIREVFQHALPPRHDTGGQPLEYSSGRIKQEMGYRKVVNEEKLKAIINSKEFKAVAEEVKNGETVEIKIEGYLPGGATYRIQPKAKSRLKPSERVDQAAQNKLSRPRSQTAPARVVIKDDESLSEVTIDTSETLADEIVIELAPPKKDEARPPRPAHPPMKPDVSPGSKFGGKG